MFRLFKSIFLIFLFLFFCLTFVFAEEITITTYYPSPYGVYKTLRLYPNNDAAAGAVCTNAGELFYNQTSNKILFCDGSTWKSMAGRAGESVMYLRGEGVAAPDNCPAGWIEADMKGEWSGVNKNWVRTCYRTDSICQVMYLRGEGVAAPDNCPAGWIEADMKGEWSGVNKNWVRTCYLCN